MVDVVDVVVPLRIVEDRTAVLALEQVGVVGVVLEHQMDVAPRRDRLPHGQRDLLQNMRLAVVDDPVHGIEAQPVEAVFLEPVQHVVNRDVAYRALSIVDRGPPGRVLLRIEVIGRVKAEVVPLGPEVIVDHVQKRHQAAAVDLVDQPLELVGAAVAGIRRERQHAVVAPVARAQKIRKRHQLDRGHAEPGQMVELTAQAIVGALLAERADMQLVKHRLVPRPALPVRMPPLVAARIDHQARPVHVVGLEARDRVGHRLPVVEPEGIAAAGPCLGGGELEPAIRLCCHRDGLVAAGQQQRHLALPRRPEAKANAAVLQGCAERHRMAEGRAHAPLPQAAWQMNRISARPGTWKTCPTACTAASPSMSGSVVSRLRRQPTPPAIRGSLNGTISW